jgi:uncharacterized RmlC-like cupin family protein
MTTGTAAGAAGDGFHPHLDGPADGEDAAVPRGLRHIRAGELDPETAQSSGMRRLAAISGRAVGARKLWMGETRVSPGAVSADHHHGASETAIHVVSGHPEFVFLEEDGAGGTREVRLRTAPGDYVFVPPHVPHREENPAPDEEAVVVIARSTQEAVVVNLPGLYVPGGPGDPNSR